MHQHVSFVKGLVLSVVIQLAWLPGLIVAGDQEQETGCAMDVQDQEEAELEQFQRQLYLISGVHVVDYSGQPQNPEQLEHGQQLVVVGVLLGEHKAHDHIKRNGRENVNPELEASGVSRSYLLWINHFISVLVVVEGGPEVNNDV